MLLDDLHRFVTILRSQSNATVEMDLAKLDLLVAIAKEPGLTAGEYAGKVGMPLSSTNRYLREMRGGQSGRERPKVGIGLVEARAVPNDWRKHEVIVTRKGKLLLEQLLTLGSKPGVAGDAPTP